MQLCFQYAYGKTATQGGELTVETVSELLDGLPIQRYCSINFEAMKTINDLIGGVDLTCLEDLTWYDPYYVKGNQLHLMGDQALEYIRRRDRHRVDGGMGRVQRQKQYALAFADKIKSAVKDDLLLPGKILRNIQENMSTDISNEEMVYLIKELLKSSYEENNMYILSGNYSMGEKFAEFNIAQEETKKLLLTLFYQKTVN